MNPAFLYAILSVILVSLISFIGIFILLVKIKKINKFLIYLVSFAAGALLGDAFIHIIPELIESNSFTLATSFYILSGIGIMFILEKFVHWQHCHRNISEKSHVHPFAYTNLIGDALHNFIDGIIIAGSYIASVKIGIATTIAVVLHEIPQEIGDFGILVHGGFSRMKALMLNFASALFALLGALITFALSSKIGNIEAILLPIAAGGFIYIAGSDLIPELHKETNVKKSLIQLISLIIGALIISALIFLE